MASPSSNENLLWPQPEGYDRASFLPVGKAKGGRAELAWPGMIRDSLNDLNSLVTAPGKAWQGRLSPEELAKLPSQVGQLALFDSPVGLAEGAAAGGAETALQHNIFAGVRAKTANMPKLGDALTLEGRGAHPEDIWNSTGWFRGPDSKWRFEIPDAPANIPSHADLPSSGTVAPPRGNLGNFLDHPDLYKAYPQMANTPLKSTSGGMGIYNQNDKSIGLDWQSKGSMLSTALHETQHGIQDIEGFAEGGSPDDFLSADHYNRQFTLGQNWPKLADAAKAVGADPANVMNGMRSFSRNAPLTSQAISDLKKVGDADPDLLEAFRQHYNGLATLSTEKQAANTSYESLAGEVEARNVQERHEQGYGAETSPWQTPGYTPSSQQIVKMPDGSSAMATPVQHDPFAPKPALVPVEHDPWQHTAAPVDHDPFATEGAANE